MEEIAYKDKAEWLRLRRNYIGGSDAAAVLGLDNYKSAYTLWAEKTGKVPEFSGSITTRVGQHLEELVARLWCEETGKQVRRKNRMLVNPQYPWACADIDRAVVGERALLEIKTTNSLPVMRQVRGGDYPERWYCQMVHYLAVTGFDKAYLAVLVNCRELMLFELERDEGEIAALMHAEETFWEHVVNDNPPETDGSDSTLGTLEAVFGSSVPGEADLSGRSIILDEWSTLKRQSKAIGERMSEIEALLKADMGDMEAGRCGAYKITWRSQQRRTFHPEILRTDHPDIDLDSYYTTTKTRPFRIAVQAEE